ncbi:MAG: nucleoside-diphosphate kinase [Acidobacteriota bacterium]|nr:nucleoside-diphosphate kinase [Acidobacteriota bacterium]NLH69025.1 nucleoside-diphosphate kinase [Brooklawnia sp.]
MSSIERTLVLVKPDGVARGLVGQIIGRYEAKGLTLVALEMRTISSELAAQHYAEHVGRPYYPGLVEFVTSGPLVAMVLEGHRAIEAVRLLNGATDSAVAAPGTIRGDLALSNRRNLVHASDSAVTAAREIDLWFPGLS